MITLPIEDARTRLAEIVEKLSPGEEILLTRHGQPMATVRAAPATGAGPRRLGTLKGSVVRIAPDFDAVPEGFEDYLP